MDYVTTRQPHEVRGYISMPTGSGKTVIFAEAIKQLNVPTLVLVPTRQLVSQTLEQLHKTMPHMRINGLRGNRRDVGQYDVVVTTYASIAQKVGEAHFALNPIRYQLVIMDEAHRSMGTMSRRYIEQNLQHAMHLGFTATEDYSDKRRLADYLYDEVHKVGVKEAVDMGMVAPYRVAALHTNTDMRNVTVKIDDYDQVELEHTLSQPLRNQQIIDFYADNLAGEKVMFNVNSIKHAEILADGLRKSGIPAQAIYGAMSKTEQNSILGALREGKITAITQARLLGEGFDEPSLSVVINVTPTMSYVRSQQRSGRALRLDPRRQEKVALIVECVDENYVASPAYFGDEAVAGWYGVDGFIDATEAVSTYRSTLPVTAKSSSAALLPKTSHDYVDRARKAQETKMRNAERKRAEAAQERMVQRRQDQLDELDFEYQNPDISEQDMNPIEDLCETNAVARYIIIGTDLYEEDMTRTSIQGALSGLAGTHWDTQSDQEILFRLRTIQQTYSKATTSYDYEDEDQGGQIALTAGLPGSADSESWQANADCMGVDHNLFFPERGASTKEAKQVCQGCVVREDCLEYALGNGEKFGIWGGLSERERRRVRRQRALARAAATAAQKDA